MICASIGEKDFGKCRQLLSYFSFCELRGDLCALSLKEQEDLLEENRNVIFTYRFSESDKKTSLEQTILAIKKGVWAVDLDRGVPADYLSKVRKAIAKQSGTKLIISWHSDTMPALEELAKIAEDCKRKGADIVKVAPTAKTLEEASRILRLYFSDVIERNRLIAFAQGEAGRWTRLACLSLGSPVSYAAAGKATAEGQLSYGEMAKEVPATFRIGDISQSGLFSRKRHACVCIPCSKSIVQRAILSAAITNGQCVLRNYEPCEDIKSAIAFVRKCGCVVKATRDGSSARGEKMLIIRSAGIAKWKSFQTAEAGQSALLMRMLLPVCAYASSLRNRTVIASRINVTGSGSLAERNLSSDIQSLKSAGVK